MTLRCPGCGSTAVQTALRDPQLDDVPAFIDPMSYGRVYTCTSCGHEWKPSGAAADVLVGGRSYHLDSVDTTYLEGWLADRYEGVEPVKDDEPGAGAALLRALELRAAIPDDHLPIELSDMQIDVLADVLEDHLVAGSVGLTALAQAVRRYRGEPEYRSLD
jgi:hypothetical protein